jgi:hypothetical protein
LKSAETNALSAPLHGLTVGPVPLSTTPIPLRSSALVTSDIRSRAHISGGFRPRLGARRCASASLPYAVLSGCAPLSASRPQTEGSSMQTEACNLRRAMNDLPQRQKLDPRLVESLKKTYEGLMQRDQVLTPERLNQCYSLFQSRFGPEVLSKLQGEELLKFLHGRPGKNSLVYWLEFKNDDEFPAKFGSIAGGSALKFGLYWRKDTGEWTAGSPLNQKSIPIPEAIATAEKQRDQLLSAVKLLENFPQNASDSDYAKLQVQMDQLAPDVSAYAWGHKYLSLLFPNTLDDYHNPEYQKHHLIKLLISPASQAGLYASAGKFVRLAQELGWQMNHLTTVLNERDGNPVNYWRVGTKLGEGADAQDIWQDMKAGGYVAIGWPGLGDLSGLIESKDAKDKIAGSLASTFEYKPNIASRKAGEIRSFLKDIADRDIVLAAAGERILGVGVVTGPYRFTDTNPKEAPHRRDVEWHVCQEWRLPVSEGLRTTVYRLKEDHENLIEAEKRLLEPKEKSSPANKDATMQSSNPEPLPLNIILYGPPGTGKTHRLRNKYMEMFTDRQAILSAEEHASALVKDLAWWEVITLALLDSKEHKASVAQILEHPLIRARLKLSANKNPRAMLWASLQSHTKKDCPTVNYTTRIDPLLFSKDEESVWSIDAKLAEVETPELIQSLQQFRNPAKEVPEVCRYKFTTFHQSFSYEDFVEGIKPQSDGGQLSYEVRDGIFKKACREAAANPDKPYALFIDEINRGNVANILGELITLIEDDKRIGAENELTPELPYSRQPFGVPKNLHIIGTMNTADRSVEALDTALRRRFTFIEMRPDPSCIDQPASLEIDLRKLLIAINARIEQLLDHDHCIGHAYFMSIKDLSDLRSVFANKVLPLLREYFYGSPAKVGMVLGEHFVNRQSSKTPFAPGSWGAGELDEKEVYAFADVNQLTEADFQTIYAEANPGI